MDLLHGMRVFQLAVDKGSFAAVARHLDVSAAAISKTINDLEAQLEARLLQRTTRSMHLTEAGAMYYDRVTRILDDLEDANSALHELQHSPKGLLRVSAPMTVALLCLSDAIPQLLEQHPEMRLELQLDDRRVNLVDQGFDIALRGSDALEDSSLVARKLLTMSHVLCCSPGYIQRYGTPKTPQDIAKHECAQFTLSDHTSEWTFRRNDEEVTVPIHGRYRVNSSLAVRDALTAGFGLSLVPRLYVQEQLRNGQLVTLLDDWSTNVTTLYAVYPSRRHVVTKVRVFLDFLVEQLGNLPK